MALKSYELAIRQRGTLHFIASDPTNIVLIPHTKSFVDGTKKFVPGTPRIGQDFKVIWGGENGIVRQTPNGVRRFDFILVGMPDAIVSVGDQFQSGKAVVEYVYPFNGYEVKAGGVIHGGE